MILDLHCAPKPPCSPQKHLHRAIQIHQSLKRIYYRYCSMSYGTASHCSGCRPMRRCGRLALRSDILRQSLALLRLEVESTQHHRLRDFSRVCTPFFVLSARNHRILCRQNRFSNEMRCFRPLSAKYTAKSCRQDGVRSETVLQTVVSWGGNVQGLLPPWGP